MRIYDITLTISPTIPVWPGDPPVELYRHMRIEDGYEYNLSTLALGVHTGTHLDAPCHFLAGKQPAVDDLDLTAMIGPALVVQVPDSVELITAQVVKALEIPGGTQRILFKTRNAKLWDESPLTFREDFVAVDESAAQVLVDMGIRLVGVDYLSVAPFTASIPTHRVLLTARVIPLEGLDLRAVPAGTYQLICLPMKLGGSDGAPVRAVLIED